MQDPSVVWEQAVAKGEELFQAADYDGVVTLLEPLLRDMERSAGADAVILIRAHRALAKALIKKNAIDAARQHLLQALELAKSEKRVSRQEVAGLKSNLAVVAYYRGEYPEAIALGEQAREVREEFPGKGDPDLGAIYNNLGTFYETVGQYRKALSYHHKSLERKRKVNGLESKEMFAAYMNLGVLYGVISDHVASRRYFVQAYRLARKLFGHDHEHVAMALNNLGVSYARMREFERSIALRKKALAILEKMSDPQNPEVARTYHNLADDSLELGELEAAKSYISRAIELRSHFMSPEHPEFLSSRHLWGRILLASGKAEDAIENLADVLRKRRQIFPRHHSLVVANLQSLASAHIANADYETAFTYIREALESHAQHQVLAFSLLDNDAKLRHNEQTRDIYGSLFEIAVFHQNGDTRLVLDRWVSFKGSATSYLASLSLLRERAPVAVQAELERYFTVCRELAQLLFADPKRRPRAEIEAHRQRLVTEVSELEAELGNAIADFQQALELRHIGIDALVRSLRPGEAFLDFAVFENGIYGVLVRVDGACALRKLGEAESLASLVQAFLEGARAAGDISAHQRKLYDILIAPFRNDLGGVDRLFFSPDGPLNFLPLEMLHDGDALLLEHFRCATIPSPRDLVRLRRYRHEDREVRPPALFGDPAFSSRRVASERSGTSAVSEVKERSEPYVAWLRRLPVHRLPGTGEEVREIGRLLPDAKLYLREEASKQNLMALDRPRLLHLATHGYVYTGDDPRVGSLQRSLLAFAGAQYARRAGREDGFVVAQELATLDLRGTRLVVLSACDSALGRLHAGEGLMGLYQALFAAGAEGVIATLWRVRDDFAGEFMSRFYARYVAGVEAAEALQKTKQDYLGTKHSDWAAFVFFGSDSILGQS